MGKIVGVFRSVVFLGWLSVALATTTVAASIWAVQMTMTVATMSANAAATAIAHRKQLARAVAKARAKARLRRAIIAFPVIGVGVITYFEERDYREWLVENPDGTRQQYGCEVASLSAEVIDDVLQDLPEAMRPAPATVLGYMSEC